MNRLLTFVLLIAYNASMTSGLPLPRLSQLFSRQSSTTLLKATKGTAAPVYNYQIPAPPTPPPFDYYTRNLNTLNKIYNLTVYPNNLGIVFDGTPSVPDHLFTNDTSGRVSPLGNFTDYITSIEYFFGLAPVPIESTTGAVFSKAEIVHFQSSCPEVASSTVYFTASTVNGTFITKLKQIGFWRFDRDSGAVKEYDLTVTGLEDFTSAILGDADFNDKAVQLGQIQKVCAGASAYCTGQYKQYDSFNDCVAQLSAKKFGTFYQAWSDSVVCRSVHVILAASRPDIHCPHVGPTGGMKCVDYPYLLRDFGDKDLFGAGETAFICPDRLPPKPQSGCA